jgi:hypothetical protein
VIDEVVLYTIDQMPYTMSHERAAQSGSDALCKRFERSGVCKVDLPATAKRPRVVAQLQHQPASWWRERRFDALALLLPLALLAIEMLLVLRTGLIRFPGTGNDFRGDYYFYINMALPNCNGFPHNACNSFYSHDNPFIYRVLVPYTVHGLILLGLSFRKGFFLLMSTSMILNIIGIYVLAHGAGLRRLEAMFTASAFSTLLWTVAFNVREYFLVDPEAYAFIVWILIACQRQRYWLAAVLTTVGILCKESVLIATALVAVQLVMTYWSPLSARVGDMLHGRIIALARMIPLTRWLQLLALIGGTIIPFIVVRIVRHPQNHITLVGTWQKAILGRFSDGLWMAVWNSITRGGWGTYGVLLAWALAGLLIGAWRKAGWSGWAWLAAFIIWLYGFALASDWERLSINSWPLLLLAAALGIHEVSRRWRISPVLLWGITIIIQIIFEPVAWTFPSSSYLLSLAQLYGPFSAISFAIGVPLMVVSSALIFIAAGVIAFIPGLLPKTIEEHKRISPPFQPNPIQ